jgi:tripartite-type tricarboxylate transporter receptor subunit TctC
MIMTNTVRRRTAMLAAAAVMTACAAFGPSAFAQAWPSKPVRVVIPYAPGGGTDIVARLIANKMSGNLGQSFIVESRPGAAGNVGSDIVAKSAPDGYTLLVTNPSSFSINQFLYKNLPYSPEKDLTGVMVVAEYPNVLVVHKDLPVNSIKELIEYAKARPKQLNFASAGNGSSGHLTMELFASMVGLTLTHIPYKGSALAMMDLVAGRVQLNFDALPVYLARIRDGSVRALGVSTARRSHTLPDVPTIADAGVPGFDAPSWFAMGAPAQTPPEILNQISAEANKALSDPTVTARLLDLGFQPVGGTPAQTNRYFAAEAAKWKRVVEASGATADN